MPPWPEPSCISTSYSALRLRTSDATSLFYSDSSSYSVTRLDKTALTTSMALYGLQPGTVTIDGTDLYWTHVECTQMSGGSCIAWETLFKKSPIGGSISGTRLFSVPGRFSTRALRFDGTCIYWDDSRDRSISKMAK